MNLKNCDIYQLKSVISHKKLICFGMGKVLQDFISDFAFMEFEKDIFAIADNKIERDGEITLINGIPVKLIIPKELVFIKDMIILISCADITGVYEQVEQYKLSKSIDCYAVYFVRSETNKTDEKKREYPKTFRITKEQKIPKIIHYCWFGKNPMPEKNLRWMRSWKKYCPDYQIVRWDESNYDITKNVYIYEAYKEKKYGFVSDYARLDIVYHHGGIYLDTDVELIKPYDELLYQAAFCGIEASRKINLGLGFGAEKEFLILKELMNLYENIHFIDEYGNSDLTTCVTLQHPFYKKKGFIENGEYQIIDGLTVYPESVLSPKDLYTGEMRITDNTFSIHHFEGSWVDEKVHNKIEERKNLFYKLMKDV